MSDKLNVKTSGNKVAISSDAGENLRQAKAAAANNPLDGLNLTQALTYLDANVTDVASVRAALKHITKLLFVLQASHERRARPRN
jgi:hypothetical protein